MQTRPGAAELQSGHKGRVGFCSDVICQSVEPSFLTQPWNKQSFVCPKVGPDDITKGEQHGCFTLAGEGTNCHTFRGWETAEGLQREFDWTSPSVLEFTVSPLTAGACCGKGRFYNCSAFPSGHQAGLWLPICKLIYAVGRMGRMQGLFRCSANSP